MLIDPRAQPGSGDGGRRSSPQHSRAAIPSKTAVVVRGSRPTHAVASLEREKVANLHFKDRAGADDLRHTVHVARPCSTEWCVQGVRLFNPSVIAKEANGIHDIPL